MTEDALHERGKALEDRFFRDRDRELLKKLRNDVQSAGERDSLAAVSGIQDTEVLDELLTHHITAENLTAISIVPLVAVAWADDKMEDAEVAAVLKAAHQAGIAEGTGAHSLVESWLKEQPDDDLLDAWKEYVIALKSTLAEAPYAQLKTTVMERARDVAASAGGFLGMGSKISAVERKVLAELESVFAD